MLVRIDSIQKLQDFLFYKTWKNDAHIVTELKEEKAKFKTELWCQGVKCAELRKLTTHMADLAWYELFKVDYIFVNEQEFKEYVNNYQWHDMSVATRQAIFRNMRYRLARKQSCVNS